MTILAENEVYRVCTKPGVLTVLRLEDGKALTLTGRGLAANFRKNLAEVDGDVERVVSMWKRAQGHGLVWQ